MPLYKLDVPPNTPISTPIKQSYDVGRRYIENMIVRIPNGHDNLAFLQVRSKGVQIVPDFGSGEQWVFGDDCEIVFELKRNLDGPPYEITLHGYNTDDTYSHAFTVELH